MADRKPSPAVQSLASQAMREPETLSLDQIQTLGASLVAQSDGPAAKGETDLAAIANAWARVAEVPFLGEGGRLYCRLYIGVEQLADVVGALRKS